MIQRLICFALFLLPLVSCEKTFFKLSDGEIIETDDAAYFGSGSSSAYLDAFMNDQIVHVGNVTELDSLVTFLGSSANLANIPTIGGSISSDYFSNFDFTKYHLFAVFIQYEGKSAGKITKEKLKVNQSREELKFKIKIEVKVGGSGMDDYQKLFFFKVPIEEASYNFSGEIALNEKAGISGSDKDYTNSYTLP
ncbi:MAG: hypothetical protein AB8B56_16165 [Crocinitomicaceae bacterium]